jgi:uncharacterized protein YwgA
MSLFLSRTWEHALLAKVVQEAATVAQEEGGYLGRTAVQKILYFLQVSGVPMQYRFEVCHYGPFCNAILGDTEWLLADDVIADSSANPEKYSKYTPGPACDELLSKHASRLKEYEGAVKKMVKTLLPLKPDHLELIATLDYAFREMKGTVGKKPNKDSVIDRFREFKGAKFDSKEISDTYDDLESAGLFN